MGLLDGEDDLFAGIEGMLDNKNKAMDKVIDNLYKDDEFTIQRTTDLSSKDLIWATKLELVCCFLVDEYVYDKELKARCKEIKNSIYRIRVSKDRLGRTENFDALKSQIYVRTMESLKSEATKNVG